MNFAMIAWRETCVSVIVANQRRPGVNSVLYNFPPFLIREILSYLKPSDCNIW